MYSLLPTECWKEGNLWRKTSLLQDNPHWHWFKKLFRPVHCYSVHLLYVLQIEFVSKKWKLCQLALYFVWRVLPFFYSPPKQQDDDFRRKRSTEWRNLKSGKEIIIIQPFIFRIRRYFFCLKFKWCKRAN